MVEVECGLGWVVVVVFIYVDDDVFGFYYVELCLVVVVGCVVVDVFVDLYWVMNFGVVFGYLGEGFFCFGVVGY